MAADGLEMDVFRLHIVGMIGAGFGPDVGRLYLGRVCHLAHSGRALLQQHGPQVARIKKTCGARGADQAPKNLHQTAPSRTITTPCEMGHILHGPRPPVHSSTCVFGLELVPIELLPNASRRPVASASATHYSLYPIFRSRSFRHAMSASVSTPSGEAPSTTPSTPRPSSVCATITCVALAVAQ